MNRFILDKNKKQVLQSIGKYNNEELLNCCFKKLTCCFTGHRPDKLRWFNNEDIKDFEKIKTIITNQIESLILNGYTTFINGMAIGFDMLCLDILIELKAKYPQIMIIGAIPCERQELKWDKENKLKYEEYINKIDCIRCVFSHYTMFCMQERNKYMVDNSNIILSMYDGYSSGGTKNTIDYAKRCKKQVININPTTFVITKKDYSKEEN